MILTGSPISSTKISPLRVAQRTGADDQLHGLRDRHEVAGHPLVGHRHRTAGGDLAAEDRHDRARRAEHVAEADGRVPGARVLGGLGLDRPLGQRLGGAHHGRRVDRLVGGDEHEVPDPELAGDPGDQPRGERVVADRLHGVGLHHRHVLVGGGVEDDRRAVLGDHLPHPLLLLAVGQHRHGGADVAILLELAPDLEQVVLGVVDEHQPVRPDAGDLPAQLGADRAAGAGDEHDLARQVGADPLQLLAHRLAAQHVLDPHLAQLAGDAQLARAVPQQLEHGRRRAHRDSALAAGGHHAGAQRARGRRDRDHDLVGLDLVEHAAEIGAPTWSPAP